MDMAAGSDSSYDDELDGVLRERSVRPVFQPVVDLDSLAVLGFEALARGPAGTALETPDQLFAAAREQDRVPELDWLCREVAVEAARSAEFRHPLSLFVNAEPHALRATAGEAQRWRSFGDLRCYTEITERALATWPAALLRAIEQIREQDWGIALDDIGVDRLSLALMPLLRPDVLKLDMGLLRRTADREAVRVVHAVLHQAGETGAMVVAEGIETDRQLEAARSYGVSLGQGYLLGRPAPLPVALDFPARAVPLVDRVVDRSLAPAPFALVTSRTPTRRLSQRAVLELARQLLDQAVELRPEPVVLAAVADPALLTEGLRAGLGAAGEQLALTAVLSSTGDLDLPGVRVAGLPEGDPARHDFDVAVMSPYYAGALVARPAGTAGNWDGDTWDAALTFSRKLVAGAANALLGRLPAERGPIAEVS